MLSFWFCEIYGGAWRRSLKTCFQCRYKILFITQDIRGSYVTIATCMYCARALFCKLPNTCTASLTLRWLYSMNFVELSLCSWLPRQLIPTEHDLGEIYLISIHFTYEGAMSQLHVLKVVIFIIFYSHMSTMSVYWRSSPDYKTVVPEMLLVAYTTCTMSWYQLRLGLFYTCTCCTSRAVMYVNASTRANSTSQLCILLF